MKDESKLQDVIEMLLDDVHEGMESEIVFIKDQVQQIKALLVNAIASLHEAFESIDNQSTEQMRLFSNIMSETVAGSEKGDSGYAEDAGKILTELLDSLIHDSRESLNALTGMSETVIKMRDTISDARKTSGLLERVHALASEKSPDIEAIRKFSGEAMDVHKSMLKQAESIQGSCVHAKHLVNEVSSSDLDKVFRSKAKVEEILGNLNQKSDLISNCRAEVNSVNAELRLHLGSAIRALQFEDIVSQSLGHTDLHLDRMNGFISRLSKGISELHQKNDLCLSEYAGELGKLHAEIMSYRNELRLEEKNPVSQKNMDEGDVELF